MSMFNLEIVTLARLLIDEARERSLRIVTAESCTGGLVAGAICSIPGSSDVFERGFVTYSNRAKQELLGVPGDLIADLGAVSEPVARMMAEGALENSNAHLAVAVTGIAGPGGGTSEKPVGTVFIALAAASGTKVINPVNRYDRETFKHLTCLQALELLRRTLS
jgi:nicotinamide-nucleotide amidase